MTYREKLIANGALRPIALRKTLRLDTAGKEAAVRHIAEYLADPEFFNTRPFIAVAPPEYWS